MQNYNHQKIEKKWPHKKLSADRQKEAGFLRGKQKEYDHKVIERKWRRYWENKKIYKAADKNRSKQNFYTLVEIPYPSGNLHVGHWYAFSVPDIFARYKRMWGMNVMFPIGFDAFGLPAENAAIKRGLNPKKWTYDNIKYMENQLRSMGASFDWDRKIITADPEYYRWTQWMFLHLFKKNLAYQKETQANWCPSCKTVLANEQVVSGRCERCDSEVEKKNILQWNLKITDYAEQLLNDLDELQWPEPIKESQRNWIGKSEGAEIKFQISNSKSQIPVFTTRPDTIFGATYLVLSPEHEKIPNYNHQITNWDEVIRYIEQSKKKTEIERTAENREKTGVELKGIKAINPATKEEIPIFVADYVLSGYGTGAIMAVPAHDERDLEFAKKYNLPIKQVIAPFFIDKDNPPKEEKKWSPRKAVQAVIKHPEKDEIVQIHWKKMPWKTLVIGGVEEGESFEEAVIREVREETGFKNFRKVEKLGWEIRSQFYAEHKDINRDAHVQVFIVELEDLEQDKLSEEESEKHTVNWVPTSDLEKTFWPISELPEIVANIKNRKYVFSGNGKLINSSEFNDLDSEKAKDEIIKFVGGTKKTTYKLRDWGVSRQRYWGVPIPIIHCEKCGQVPVPDKDLPVKLPEIKDYLPRNDGKSPLAKAEKWVSVKCPNCKGKAERETDTLDTFVDSSWYFLRYTDPKNKKEFADKKKMEDWMPVDFYSGGAEHNTMHLLYSRFWQKALYDLGLVKDKEPYKMRMNRGLILGPDGNKMSKSKGNVVDPDEIVRNLGADTVRTYLSFIGPFNETGHYPWSTDGIVGVRRFLERVWKLREKVTEGENVKDEILFNRTIKKVGEDIQSLKMNTAVSALMIFTNALAKQNTISKKEFETLLILLAPFAPHLTEELWQAVLKKKSSIHQEKWPKFNPKKIGRNMTTIAIQINGKVRAVMEAEGQESEEKIKEMALSQEAVQKWIVGKEIKKVIYVKGKVLNIVLTPAPTFA